MNEADNTFRSLKEQTLLVTSRWCKFGIHSWQKWTEPKKNTMHFSYCQQRYCDSCGHFEQKKVPDVY